MIVYVDTSVLLRRLLGQAHALRPWGAWERAYASVLVRLEFLRSVDRLRLDGKITDVERVALHRRFQVCWEALHRVPLAEAILERAGQPFATVLGTLDALHLATALAVMQTAKAPLVMLTHDAQLGRAAAAAGLEVDGT